MRLIDIHCHMLPGIDDGPVDLDEALSMARRAAEKSVTQAIITPHVYPGRYDNERAGLEASFAQFANALVEHNIELNMHLGAEVRLAPEIIGWIDSGRVPFMGTWNGMHVLLLELPDSHIPPGTDQFIRALKQRGIVALIAHPERNKTLMKEPARVEMLLDLGCLLQLTAASLLGVFGTRAQDACLHMLDLNAVFAMASDAHGVIRRPPILDRAYLYLMEFYGEEVAERLCWQNPGQLLGLHDDERNRVVDSSLEPRPSLAVA